MYYLRLENNSFGFVKEGIHEINDTDIMISPEDYNSFFELQSQGKQFKIKENPTGTGLFDYLEEYAPQAIKKPQEPGAEEFMLDIECRVSLLELGVRK